MFVTVHPILESFVIVILHIGISSFEKFTVLWGLKPVTYHPPMLAFLASHRAAFSFTVVTILDGLASAPSKSCHPSIKSWMYSADNPSGGSSLQLILLLYQLQTWSPFADGGCVVLSNLSANLLFHPHSLIL